MMNGQKNVKLELLIFSFH